jgi:hypothetical protein
MSKQPQQSPTADHSLSAQVYTRLYDRGDVAKKDRVGLTAESCYHSLRPVGRIFTQEARMTNRLYPWLALSLLLATGCGLQTPLDEFASNQPGNPGTGGVTVSGGSGGAGASATGGAGGANTTWPQNVTVNTCEQYATVNVGPYVVESDFWNQGICPGTQCMAINNSTGAFTVTQFPNCGDTVASYPNVLYGCSFGTCSPGSVLPRSVSSLTTVTSSWSFSVGGTAADQYDVAYDIWFCPNNNCGVGGFPNGTELMIWLDYQNVSGWETHLGTVSLDGHNWDVWVATQGASGNNWTYLAYMIQGPMVTSVANLDLSAFFKDAVSRGYVQNSWYLYAIQAGDELRTGGLPYENNSFSISIK